MKSPQKSRRVGDLGRAPAIHPAARRDISVLLGLMREYYAFDGHTFQKNRARGALERLIANRSYGRAWLMQDAATPVGYIVLTYGYSLEFLGRDAFVDELFLRPAYRGRGWGRLALRTLEKAARAAGVNAIHLEAMMGNKRAQGVYRRLGFARRPSELMTKSLRAPRKRGQAHAA